MKKVIMTLVVCLGVSCFAGEDEGKTNAFFSTELKTKFWSEYVRNGYMVHNGPVAQTEITVTGPMGFYVGAWHSAGFGGSDETRMWVDEVGPYVGWSGNVGKFVVDVGFVYYDWSPLLSGRNNAYSPYLDVSCPFVFGNHTVSPFIKGEWYIMSPESEFEGGLFATTGLRHVWEITPSVGLEQEAGVVRADGAFGYEPAWFYQHTIGLNWKVKKAPWLKISAPMVQLSTPLTKESGEKFRQVYGVGFTISF